MGELLEDGVLVVGVGSARVLTLAHVSRDQACPGAWLWNAERPERRQPGWDLQLMTWLRDASCSCHPRMIVPSILGHFDVSERVVSEIVLSIINHVLHSNQAKDTGVHAIFPPARPPCR
jgi:hypothetical protein